MSSTEVILFHWDQCGHCHKLLAKLHEADENWRQNLGITALEVHRDSTEYKTYHSHPNMVPQIYAYPNGRDQAPVNIADTLGEVSSQWTYEDIVNWVKQQCHGGRCNAMTNSGHQCRNSNNCYHHAGSQNRR